MSDLSAKRSLLTTLGSMTGKQRVRISEARNRHTDPQRKFYFGACVEALQEYMRLQGQYKTKDEIHEIIKFKFLRDNVIDHNTGEILSEELRSIKKMDVKQMSEFLEAVIVWLSELGIVLPDRAMFA